MNALKKIFKPRSILGVSIIALALLILLENVGFSLFRSVLSNWPLGLIILGVAMLYGPNKNKSRMMPYILIGLGVLFMLGLYNVFNVQWSKYIIPVLLLLLGFYLLKPRMLEMVALDERENNIEVCSILGGGEYNTRSKDLNSGNVLCILGGADIDIREADMKADSMGLDILAFMGGVEIKVPPHWQVSVKAIPFLGSVGNSTTCLADEMQMPKKTLIVKGVAILGGIDIRN